MRYISAIFSLPISFSDFSRSPFVAKWYRRFTAFRSVWPVQFYVAENRTWSTDLSYRVIQMVKYLERRADNATTKVLSIPSFYSSLLHVIRRVPGCFILSTKPYKGKLRRTGFSLKSSVSKQNPTVNVKSKFVVWSPFLVITQWMNGIFLITRQLWGDCDMIRRL